MKKHFIYSILFLCAFSILNITTALAQTDEDIELAEAYYKNNEFEKAVVLFDKIYASKMNDPAFYKKYLNVLFDLKQYDKLEKIIKKQIKNNPGQLGFIFDLANVYEKQNLTEKVTDQYNEILKKITPQSVVIKQIADAFIEKNLYDYAVQTYNKGEKILNNPGVYAYEKAAILGKQGKQKEMFEAMVSVAQNSNDKIQDIKNSVQKYLDNDDAAMDLQSAIYKQIQSQPDNIGLIDLLIWTYIQRKDFETAINQSKAIDKRFNSKGQSVLQIAQSAADEGFYDAAINGFSYITNLGIDEPFYYEAQSKLLKTRKLKIEQSNDYTNTDLLNLKSDYLNYIATANPQNPMRQPFYIQTSRDLAQLEALYFHNYDSAINIIDNVVANVPLDKIMSNRCKLDKADYLLMENDEWESTLLYSQVDKALPGQPLGEIAKFKNTKWSYYFGDFEWAQSQMEILKSSTSEEIANDALDLSIFIIENLGSGDDSIMNLNAMKMFAKADLLSFQNKNKEALQLYDSIVLFYPNNNLDDDIAYAKADLLIKDKKYDAAITLLDYILNKYSEDVLADDAMFLKADLFQYKLNQADKAKELYSDLLVKYPGSTFAVEARKRFRKLRGDKIGTD